MASGIAGRTNVENDGAANLTMLFKAAEGPLRREVGPRAPAPEQGARYRVISFTVPGWPASTVARSTA